MALPPGTLLQHMYLKERLSRIPPGKFIEIGVGQGFLSSLLLAAGWRGLGYDLNNNSVSVATTLNREAINKGGYEIRNENWFNSNYNKPVDLIISSMVLEHLNDADEANYFMKCKRLLKKGGIAILFVPGSPAHWGIEDEIAGHVRRYTFGKMEKTLNNINWEIVHIAGLTYPLSNLLLPLSNFLVYRSEIDKKKESMSERTRLSGNRDVLLKTRFPKGLNLLLNEKMMYPFHFLQKLNIKNKKSLVLYTECRPTW